jgi:Asp-tRNA(Asn)/Glu-tRNA(Gln) amidotransferase A subunit family amidase
LGGIILGKTVCTAFGVALPGPTVNPRDPRRTPGGSSSGSAAAVAAGFVSFALGSQTAGSTIRPASYCGVTGYKPTFGLLPTVGMAALSTTLDHLGIFARSPRDAWYFASALALAREEKLAARKPKRLLILRVPAEIGIGDDYPARLEELASCVAWDGVEVETLDLPFAFDDFALLQKRLCYWEAARLLPASAQFRLTAAQWAAFGSYLDVDVSLYANARLQQGSCQAKFQQLATSYDAVLMPAATGAAPPTLGNTGDAVMNRFWTALHVPVLSVPMWVTEDGAPLGLQVIGALGDDRSLCEIAQWFFEEHAADPVGQ